MRRKINKKYHYFYKITNVINNHYYYGIHSTDDLNDGYMGSGTRLHYAYKKYGIENFTKEIIKFFDTREQASNYESEMVTESLVKDDNCYNSIKGGDNFDIVGMVTVYDINEKRYRMITKEDFDTNHDRYHGLSYGMVNVKDKEKGGYTFIPCEEFYKNNSLYETPMHNKLTVKDNNGNYFAVSVNDERYINGELKPIWYGRKHKQETIEKVKETFKDINHQQGEKNSQYGTCWITNGKENLKINKNDLEKYLLNGWRKGRICDSNNKKINKINIEEIVSLKNKGYTWKEIGNKIGVCHATLYKFKKEHNLI